MLWIWLLSCSIALLDGAPKQQTADWVQGLERLGGVTMPSEQNETDFTQLVVEAEKKFPQDWATQYWRGEWLHRQRRQLDAEKSWRAIVQSAEHDAPRQIWEAGYRLKAIDRLVYIHLSKIQTDEAEKLARAAVALHPKSVVGYRCLYDVAFRTGKLEEVEKLTAEASARWGQEAPDVVALHHEMMCQFGRLQQLRAELDAVPLERRRPEDDHHFRARLAVLEGDQAGAFWWHFSAYHAGSADAGGVRKSRAFLEKFRFQEESRLADPVLSVVRAWNALERPSTAEQAWPAIEKVSPGAEQPSAMVIRYLQAWAASATSKPDALERWRRLVKDYPTFAPGLVGLAESLEGTGTAAEASEWFNKARAIQPNNWKVREIDRMGVHWRPTPDGVEAATVDAKLAWGRFGLEAGCVLVELDGIKLESMPIEKRMSFVRLFQGGRVVFRPKGFKSTVNRDLELTFFDW